MMTFFLMVLSFAAGLGTAKLYALGKKWLAELDDYLKNL